MEHQVCAVVVVRGVAVDDDEVAAPEAADVAGRGPHRKAGAAHDQDLCAAHVAVGLGELLFGEHLAVERHVGPHYVAAFVAVRDGRGALEDVVRREALAAAHAVVFKGGAVDLRHVDGAGALVQAVDVLGDDARQFPGFFELGQLVVGPVGLYAAGLELLAVEFEEHVGVALEAVDGEQVFRLVLLELHVAHVVEAVLGAEIRDAAFGGHAGTAEEHGLIRLVYDLVEFVVHFLSCHEVPPAARPAAAALQL